MTNVRVVAALLCGGCFSPGAMAFSWEYGEFSGSVNTLITVGATVRMQERDNRIVAKVNIEGQQRICDANAAGGDPIGGCALAGFDRLAAAPGHYGLNSDQGNLNYDRHDIVAAAAKMSIDFDVNRGNFGLVGRIITNVDPVNTDFVENNPNNFSNGGFQPARSSRPREADTEIGREVDLDQLYVSGFFELGERELSVRVGKQVVTWGEALTTVVGSTNQINSPDVVRLRNPGLQLNEITDGANLAYASLSLGDSAALEFIYQLSWQPIRIDPPGTFFSTSNVAGPGGINVMLGQGNVREDPSNLAGLPQGEMANPDDFGRSCLFNTEDPNGQFNQGAHRGDLSDITENPLDFSGGRTVCRVNDTTPDDSGQWGIALSYFADFLGGVDAKFYYLNYHSRLPYASFFGVQDWAGNTPDMFPNGAADLTNVTDLGRVLKVADTVRLTLEYPEDIQMFGMSFNGNIGDFSVAGDIAYRPNLPLQVDGTDLAFYTVARAFNTSRCELAPSHLEEFRRGDRGEDCDQVALPDQGEFIEGYERFPVLNSTLVFIDLPTTNPFGADNWVRILEVGMTKVMGLPSSDILPLGAPGVDTHNSLGRDEIDADGNGRRDDDNVGPPDFAVVGLQNFQRQVDGCPTGFSWGYRFINQFEYLRLIPGYTFKPLFAFFHDVNGTSPSPGGNFIEGRKTILTGVEVQRGAYGGQILYAVNRGANEFNQERDRDNLSLHFRYSF